MVVNSICYLLRFSFFGLPLDRRCRFFTTLGPRLCLVRLNLFFNAFQWDPELFLQFFQLKLALREFSINFHEWFFNF
jgi:hypothetical protein